MPEYQTQCSCGGSPHTQDCMFQHFLSYSGCWRQPDNIRAMLRNAYIHGLDANPAYRTAPEERAPETPD